MSLNTLNRYKYTKVAIQNALKVLKTRKGVSPSFLRAHPKAFQAKGNKLYQGKRLVIAREDKETFLRTLLYENKNDYPFGRDSLFYVLKKAYLGITKRDIESFLNAQEVIVARRARPRQEKRVFSSRIRTAGILSGDLAHIRSEDLPDGYLPEKEAAAKHREYKPGVKMKKIWGAVSKDWYFYNLVDIYTGYLVSEIVATKNEDVIAKATKRLVTKMQKALGVPITEVQFDQGTEFFKSQKQLNKQGVKTRRMRTNAVVEQTNAKLQKIFYTLVAQKRSALKSTAVQAVKISNNTLNRRVKMTPSEAVTNLRLGEKVKKQRKPQKAPADVKKRAFTKGTKVRRLKEKRGKKEAGYKAYKGAHFGKVQTITRRFWYQGYPMYELDKERAKKHGGDKVSKLAWHDELIRARDADKISRDLVKGRKIQYDVQPKRKVWKDPKIARHSKRLRKGSRVTWNGKEGVIQAYRGSGKGKEWQVKVGKTNHWVKDSVLN